MMWRAQKENPLSVFGDLVKVSVDMIRVSIPLGFNECLERSAQPL